MSFFHTFFTSIIDLIHGLLELYKWIVIIAALISWVNPDPYNPVVRFLHTATEPALRPIRRFIGIRWGAVDLSTFVLIIAIIIVQIFIRSLARAF
jgi:YggT family protein